MYHDETENALYFTVSSVQTHVVNQGGNVLMQGGKPQH